ncbi:MAG TPA: glycosyltransferase family 39 protein [Herpetosiphonaceae bacterium]|nr:glycosyltransferase family 39 protein [Herpetosiphonaceae bacterium]
MKVGSTTPWPPTPSPTDVHPSRSFARVGLGTRFGVPALTVAGIISLGLALRVWMMARAGWFIDGDDGVAGIMAAHILRGERPIFLYGQSWMGAFQSYLIAISFSLFGMSRVALKLVTLFEFAAFALSLYFLARRVGGARVAALSTLLAAIPSVYVLSVTGHLWGPLLDAMTLGTLILLLAIDEAYGTTPPRRPWLRFLAIGFLGGAGFWLHGQIVIYLATAALLLFMRNKRVILQPRILGAAVGFVLGAAPVFIYAFHHEFTTFHYYLRDVLGREQFSPSLRDYQAIATHYVLVNVTRVAGIAVPWRANPDWLQLSVALIVGGAILALALRRYKGIIGWFRLSLRDGRPEDALLLYAALLSIAFVLSSFGHWALTFPHIDATGRYTVPLASVLPIMLAIEAVRLADRVRPAAALTILVLIGYTLFNYAGSAAHDVWKSPYSGLPHQPASNAELIATLDDLGVDAVWVNQWVGKPLMFDTRERISAADYFVLGGDFDRLPAHTERVRTAALPAFVFVTDEPVFGMETWLDERQIPYMKRVAPPFVVLRPLQPVDPAQVVQYMGDDR